jgi:hypothetical protein
MSDRAAAILISALFIAGSACFLIGNLVALIRALRS